MVSLSIQVKNVSQSQSSPVDIKTLYSDLRSIVGSSLFADVEIITQEGAVIPSHAVLLAVRCPTLRNVTIKFTV